MLLPACGQRGRGCLKLLTVWRCPDPKEHMRRILLFLQITLCLALSPTLYASADSATIRRINDLKHVSQTARLDSVKHIVASIHYGDDETYQASVESLLAVTSRLDKLSYLHVLIFSSQRMGERQIARLDEAQAMALELKSGFHLGWILELKSDYYRQREQYDSAMALILRARDAFEESGSSNQLVAVLHFIGDMYYAARSFDEAEQHYLQVRQLKGELEEWERWRDFVTSNNLGLIERQRGNYDKAIAHFNYSRSKKPLDDSPKLNGIRTAYICGQLAELYLSKGDHANALLYYEMGLKPSLEYEQFKFTTQLYLTKSKLLLAQNDPVGSLRVALQAVSSFKSADYSMTLDADIALHLSHVYGELGEKEAALMHLQRAYRLQETITDGLIKAQFLQMLARKDYERALANVDLLEIEKRALILSILAAIVFIAVTTMFVVRTRKANVKLSTTLAEIRTLKGLLPICSSCKSIRDDQGYWNRIETYIAHHSDATFTHGYCPDCISKYFPEVADHILKSKDSPAQPAAE